MSHIWNFFVLLFLAVVNLFSSVLGKPDERWLPDLVAADDRSVIVIKEMEQGVAGKMVGSEGVRNTFRSKKETYFKMTYAIDDAGASLSLPRIDVYRRSTPPRDPLAVNVNVVDRDVRVNLKIPMTMANFDPAVVRLDDRFHSDTIAKFLSPDTTKKLVVLGFPLTSVRLGTEIEGQPWFLGISATNNTKTLWICCPEFNLIKSVKAAVTTGSNEWMVWDYLHSQVVLVWADPADKTFVPLRHAFVWNYQTGTTRVMTLNGLSAEDLTAVLRKK